MYLVFDVGGTFIKYAWMTGNGEIIEKGIVALDAKIFLDIVRKLPDSDVVIETDSSYKTLITCEKVKINIMDKSGEDFSYLPQVEKENNIVWH